MACFISNHQTYIKSYINIYKEKPGSTSVTEVDEVPSN